MPCLITKASEWPGRVIAYFGGSGIAVFSNDVASQAKAATEYAINTQGLDSTLTISTFISVGGFLVVFARLVLDVVKYIDERKRREAEVEDDEQAE